MNNRLNPKYIFFLALALSFLILGLWYTFRYQARQTEMTDLKSQIETAQLQVQTYRQAEAQLPALREEVAGLREERAAFVAALPQQNQMAAVLSEIRRNAQATGTDIQGVAVSTAATTTDLPGGVRPIPISMQMGGTYTEVFRTLRSMETMNRFSTIDLLSLQVPEATSTDPELGGTMNMTVYTFDPSLATLPTEGAAVTADGTAAAPAAPAPAAPEGATAQ